MLLRVLKIASASLCCVVLLVNSGCSECCKGTKVTTVTKTPCAQPCDPQRGPCDKPAGEMTAELPPNAKPGECYSKVYVPPTFKTVSERILVRDATERLEIIPAVYEWVEERVCVKDASTQLVEIPAEFADRSVTVQTAQAHTDWEVTNADLCNLSTDPNKKATKNVFCLVTHPAKNETIPTRCQVRPPQVRTEVIPAQYETVRRQKLVTPATTKRICIPAEYQTVEKTIKVCDGRMAWQRVVCEKRDVEAISVNTPRTQRFDRY